MSQKLHWFLLFGCVALSSMFAPMAVRSLAVFRLPLQGLEVAGSDLSGPGELVVVADVLFESTAALPGN